MSRTLTETVRIFFRVDEGDPVALPADLFKPDDLEVCAPLSENSGIIILNIYI